MNKFLIVILSIIAVTAHAADGSVAASAASADLASQGLGQIVQGSATVVQAGSEFTVASVNTAGEFVYFTLKSAKDASEVVIKVSAALAGNASVALGQTITVVSSASGYLLEASGKAIAFVPNKLGKDLISSSQLSEK